jgi:hypothetical protein
MDQKALKSVNKCWNTQITVRWEGATTLSKTTFSITTLCVMTFSTRTLWLTACLPVWVSACLPVCLSACLPSCLPVCLTVRLPACVFGLSVSLVLSISPLLSAFFLSIYPYFSCSIVFSALSPSLSLSFFSWLWTSFSHSLTFHFYCSIAQWA